MPNKAMQSDSANCHALCVPHKGAAACYAVDCGVSSQENMSHNIHQEVIFAVRGKNLDLLMERVSAGGDINYQDEKYGSAIAEAINTGNEEILQYLIEQGANLNLESSNGIYPLEIALHHASDDIVRKLSWSGAKISSRCRPHWKERLSLCLANY